VKGESILGKEDFVEGLIDYVKEYRDIKEIPMDQRYASRPGLEVLFDEGLKGDRKKRKKKVQEAVERHGRGHLQVTFTPLPHAHVGRTQTHPV
jgi:hypothetical protein